MSDVTDVFHVIGWRNRDEGRRSEAIRTQDELRERSDESDDWSAEREVKRWRTRRSSS